MIWNNLCAAFAMFSKIPVPKVDWEKENLKFMLCFFPLVGVVIGGAFLLMAELGLREGLQAGFLCALLVLVPVVITGGIHLDGFLDTMDALSSWQGQEKKREILKDPHTGAFAVISAGTYFLCWYGACHQLLQNRQALQVMALGFILSRALSGIGVVVFPKSNPLGTVAEFAEKAGEKLVCSVLLLTAGAVVALLFMINPMYGTGVLLFAAGLFGFYYRTAVKSFGGICGDLAGWFLCLCETGICMVTAFLSGGLH